MVQQESNRRETGEKQERNRRETGEQQEGSRGAARTRQGKACQERRPPRCEVHREAPPFQLRAVELGDGGGGTLLAGVLDEGVALLHDDVDRSELSEEPDDVLLRDDAGVDVADEDA